MFLLKHGFSSRGLCCRVLFLEQSCAVGGKSVDEATRRVLRYTMTDDLACHFNWRGKGQKNAFSELQLKSVIISKCCCYC